MDVFVISFFFFGLVKIEIWSFILQLIQPESFAWALQSKG
jgi:hypothetical protein